jgi:hypothetical protein
MEKLSEYIRKKFGVSDEKFLEVFKISPGAEGYLLGSLGEQLFKEYAESIGFEVLRIKEKPEGGYNAKSDEARGDFYIRKKGSLLDEWLVVECKGVKSNSEKRANLTNKKSCLTLLKKHSIERQKHVDNIWKSGYGTYEKAKESWLAKNSIHKFPDFSWLKTNPGSGIPDLENIWGSINEIESWLNNFDDSFFTETAYWDLKAPIRLIQTHMPSSRIDKLGIKSTGPLVSEFNILCLDLFLRTGKHEFIFVNSQQLNHQAASPNHLQQNYTIDILTAKEDYKRHELLKPWYDNLENCILETKPQPRKLDISQLDSR